jgi:hypothetical protein
MIAQPFARRLRLLGLTLAISLQAALPVQAKAPANPAPERIERLILLYRHGVRAPCPVRPGWPTSPRRPWRSGPPRRPCSPRMARRR